MEKRTDRELLELLLTKVTSMETKIDSIEARMDSMETNIKELIEGQNRIENKVDDIEVQNANRHLQISARLDDINKDIAVVEAVTGKNMTEIALLKSVK